MSKWDTTLDAPPDDAFGFVYRIYPKMRPDHDYVGSKQFYKKVTRPPLKGKKNKRRSVAESDWKTYNSSCEELKAAIKKHGEQNFGFEILHLVSGGKSDLKYAETKEIFMRGQLERDTYNRFVGCRINKNNLKSLKK